MKKFVFKLTMLYIIPTILISNIFVWVYEKPEREAIKNGTHLKYNKWNAIKKNSINYDIVILGSSRGYCAYNPMIIDSASNLSSYNMCTGSQNIMESYYMLKDILKFQKPKVIIYEVFLPSFGRDPDYYQVFSNAKFMSPQTRRDMVLNECLLEKTFDLLVPVLKYKSYFKERIRNLNNNSTVSVSNSLWIKGYKPDSTIVDSSTINNFTALNTISNTNILSFSKIEDYLLQIKQLCSKNNIDFICIRAPYPPTRLEKTPTDDTNIYFSNLFRLQKIDFHDLNYTSINKFNDSDFADFHHMNSIGASKASRDLAEIINNTQQHNSLESQ